MKRIQTQKQKMADGDVPEYDSDNDSVASECSVASAISTLSARSTKKSAKSRVRKKQTNIL